MKKRNKSDIYESWRVIYSYLKEFKKEILILTVIGILSAVANASSPYILGLFFDSLIGNSFQETIFDIPQWLFFILLFALVQLIADSAYWVNSVKSSKISLSVFATHTSRCPTKLLELPVSFHKNGKWSV